MAEEGSWESIRKIGLLSTTAILDKFEVGGERRRRIESARRPEIETVEHPEHGRALIRDNKPMQEKTLGRCLTGMTPREWYESLNRRVFSGSIGDASSNCSAPGPTETSRTWCSSLTRRSCSGATPKG